MDLFFFLDREAFPLAMKHRAGAVHLLSEEEEGLRPIQHLCDTLQVLRGWRDKPGLIARDGSLPDADRLSERRLSHPLSLAGEDHHLGIESVHGSPASGRSFFLGLTRNPL